MRSRWLAFAALAVVCAAAAVAAAAIAILGAHGDRKDLADAVAAARPKVMELLSAGKPFVVFRTIDPDRATGQGSLSVAALERDALGEPLPVGPTCARVAFAADKGICLSPRSTEMVVRLLGKDLKPVSKFTLPGIPSRARVSPDGRWGGVTAFVSGHAYATPGEFSTATTIIDLRSGEPTADLETDFTVTDGDRVVDTVDRNYWGLTFAADGDTFYATLATGGRTHLIKGSISRRVAQTIHDNVECPSLSPDGTRIGYKKALSRNPTVWRFHVLDLATGKETALSETRSVDDQLAWLDDAHLLYGEDGAIWVVDADGSGRPRRWLQGADSPTVQRGSGPST